jgi:hypothetical protein
MIAYFKAACTKEFFYREPKQKSFYHDASFTADIKNFLAFFAPVNRALGGGDKLHF